MHFIATTALEEFWDISKPLIFLNEGCKRYSRKSSWGKLDAVTLQGACATQQDCIALYDQFKNYYEIFLEGLAQHLNLHHGRQYSKRYWRILLGPWLLSYVIVVLDRYTALKQVFAQYPEAVSIGLEAQYFKTPVTAFDFVSNIFTDSFNLQLYTEIWEQLGYSFPKRTLGSEPAFQANPPKTRRLKQGLKPFVQGLSRMLLNRSGILLQGSYFGAKALSKFALKSYGKVLPYYPSIPALSANSIDKDARRRLIAKLSYSDEFLNTLAQLLFHHMPQCFLEQYGALTEAVKYYPKSVKAAFSANAYFFNEHFQHWSAERAEAGMLLLGAQHGGNFGISENMQGLEHEVTVADRYFSWGWSTGDTQAQIIPKPANKLMERQPSAAGAGEGILMATTTEPRFITHFLPMNAPQIFSEYLEWQSRFTSALTQDIRRELRVRLHYIDLGWDIRNRWADHAPDIEVESWNIPFIESLKRCRLYVCDHLSTTYAEALALRKPTILFWNPQHYVIKPEALPYLEKLQKAGILYHTPEQAAAAIAAIYPDVANWWNQPERQQAVKEFCWQFARTSDTAIDEWVTEFTTLAAK